MAATLTITSSEVDTLTSNPGYSSSKNIVITGEITHTQASALKNVASPSITATVEKESVSNLKGITVLSGRTNAFTFQTSDSTASATDLVAIKALTTVAPNFSSVTGITASPVADIKSLYTGTNTSLGTETISVNDGTITAADLNTINGYTTGFVTSTATKITGTAAQLTTVQAAAAASGDKINQTVLGFAVEINDAVIDAGELDTLEGQYTGVINIASGSSITGAFADVKKVYDHTKTTPATITGLSDKAITLGTTASPKTAVADINTASGYTSAAITATMNETSLAKAKTLSETGNNITIQIDSENVAGDAFVLAADELKAVNDKTTGTITLANAITEINGSFADVSAVFNASSSEIVRQGDEKTTVSDNINTSQANALIAKTTGLVTATITDGDMATLDGITLNTATGADIPKLTITVTDSSANAGKLLALDAKTDVAKTALVVNSIAITGTLADAKKLYATNQNNTLTGLGDETVTISDATLAAADLKALEAATSKDVDVSAASAVTGAIADVKAVYAKAGSGITGLGNENVTFTDTGSVPAGDIDTINTATSGSISFGSTVTTIAGDLADINKVVTAATATTSFTPTVDAAALALKINPTDTGGLDFDDVNTLAGKVSGVVKATLKTSGDNVKLDKLIAATGGLVAGQEIAITVNTDANTNLTGAKTLGAADLIKLDNLTSGVITIAGTGTADTIEGTSAEVAAVYGSSTFSTSLANKAHKITLTGTADILATDLKTISNTVGGHTTGTSAQLTIAGSNVVGNSTDLKAVFTAYDNDKAGGGTPNAGKLKFAAANPTATITGGVALAADIKIFDSFSTGKKTLAAAVLKGVTADIEAVFADANTLGTANVDIEMTDTDGVTVANFKKVEDLTGANNITATIKDNDLATLKTLEAPNGIHTLAITVKDTSAAAADIKTVNGKTVDTVTLHGDVKTITGSATDIAEVFTLTNAGTEIKLAGSTPSVAVTATGNFSVSQVNTISNQTSGKITAGVSDNDIASLETLSDSSNSLSIIVKDASVDAAKLTALTSKTDVAITVHDPSVTAVSGKLAEVLAAYTDAKITGLGAQKAIISDAITSAEMADLDNKFTKEITATISDNYLDQLAAITKDNVKSNLTITVKGDDSTKPTERTVKAANLKTLIDKIVDTTVTTVDASTLTGSVSEVKAVVNLDKTAATPKLSGLDTIAVTVSGGKTTAGNTLSEINNIIEKAGVVTATLVDNATAAGDAQKLDKLLDATNGLKGTGNKINIELHSDAGTTGAKEVGALDLLALNAKTTGEISHSTGIDTIVGKAADVASVFADANAATNTQIKTASDIKVTISDKVVTADPTKTPPIAADPGIVQAADLVAIQKATTGAITLTAVGAISGQFSDLEVVMDTKKDKFTGEDSDKVTITDAVTVANLETISKATSAVVTATISDTEMTKLDNLTETTDNNLLTITLKDASVDATKLKALDTKTAGLVTVESSTVTGKMDDIKIVYDATTTAIAGLGNEAITVSDSITYEEANALTGYTTGLVKATVDAATVANLKKLTSSSNEYGLTLANTETSITAADLKSLDSSTAGTINASAATTITGALSDVKALYESNVSGGITGLGNEAVTISDEGSVKAADINYVNSNTSGSLTVNKVTGLTGTVAELKAAYAAYSSGTITGLGNEAITISDIGPSSSDVADIKALTTGVVTVSISSTAVTATTLKTLDAESTEDVFAGAVTSITGTAEDIKSIYSSAGITGLGDEAVILTDASTSASTLKTIDSKTSGTINAATVKTLTGSADDVSTVYSAGIAGLGDEAVTLSDTEVSATVLNSLDGKTTGAIDASSLTTITGTGTDAQTAFDSLGISGLTFDASSYLASYTDLLAAYGSDLTAARAHYFAFGVTEGRSFDGFDDSSYLASHADLLKAFGSNTDSALVHYINFGYSEGRSKDSFDENSYLASNPSLIGTTTDAAAHYVNTGYSAGLALDTFDELSYIASHSDLISAFGTDGAAGTKHFVEYGSAEGRSDTFDELAYIASHDDLISAYGTDTTSAALHYISYGSTEGRTVTFDASSYLAANADLRAEFGTDKELATKHYINFGNDEGRAIT